MLGVYPAENSSGEVQGPSPSQENLRKEFLWIQSHRSSKVFKNIQGCLRECCIKLHLGYKADDRLAVPITQPKSEQHSLSGKHGGDNLKVNVTLLGDNVLQADVAIKHLKTPGGTFRAVAQPDVQWKLQQLQDLANHILRAAEIVCDVQDKMREMGANKASNLGKRNDGEVIRDSSQVESGRQGFR